jgi:hypothetical protein
VGYEHSPVDDGALVLGAAAEFGAAYFFSRHVSLGSTLDLAATYARSEEPGFPTGDIVDVTTISARAAIRFIGAVYF